MAYFCRREVNDIGEPKRLCLKPVKTPNPMGLCDEDLARMPIWPANDDGTPCAPPTGGR